jgi:predicted DNA-binding transcriptional regulator AlpA
MSEAYLLPGIRICKRPGCGREAAPLKLFCCREHSPLGHMSDPSRQHSGRRAVVPEGRITAKEVSAKLGFWDDQIYRYARAGVIRSQRDGKGSYSFDEAEVREDLAKIKRRPGGPLAK